MGGHAGGQQASRIVVKQMMEAYYQDKSPDIGQSLINAIHYSNKAVYRYAQEHPELKGMGSTVVAVVLHNDHLHTAWVGDSRAYLFRRGRLTPLTTDHSWVQMAVKQGTITPEEAENHPQRNVVLRSVGAKPEVEPDALKPLPVEQGDMFLLCTDGLTGVVRDSEIQQILQTSAPTSKIAQHLITQANARGGPDNITVIVGRLGEAKKAKPLFSLSHLESVLPPRLTLPLIAITLGVALFAAIWGAYHFFWTDEVPYEPLHPRPAVTPLPPLLFSARLEQIILPQSPEDPYRLRVVNTNGNYWVSCRQQDVIPEQPRPPLKNLLVVYGVRSETETNPKEIEAYFIDTELFPYIGNTWRLWCLREESLPPYKTDSMQLQTSLGRRTSFYLVATRPTLPLSSSLLITGQWEFKPDEERYFFTVAPDRPIIEITPPPP
jgi:protein phosphatase